MTIDAIEIDALAVDADELDSSIIDTGDGGGGDLPAFAYFDPSQNTGDIVLSNNDKTASSSTGLGSQAFGLNVTNTDGSGKRYFEMTIDAIGSYSIGAQTTLSQAILSNGFALVSAGLFSLSVGGNVDQAIVPVPVLNDVIGFAVDFDIAPNVEYFINGVSQGSFSVIGVWGVDIRAFFDVAGFGDFPVSTLRILASELQFLPVGFSPWLII